MLSKCHPLFPNTLFLIFRMPTLLSGCIKKTQDLYFHWFISSGYLWNHAHIILISNYYESQVCVYEKEQRKILYSSCLGMSLGMGKNCILFPALAQ